MRVILAFLAVAPVMCATGTAATVICDPDSVSIKCMYEPPPDVQRIEVMYDGTTACSFNLIVVWNDVGLEELSCDDFALGGGWLSAGRVLFDCEPCPGCDRSQDHHVHVFICDTSLTGISGGCIFTIDVWEETPCANGATIYIAGDVTDCEGENCIGGDQIDPVTWGSCEVTVD
jgi:hypothetical protein